MPHAQIKPDLKCGQYPPGARRANVLSLILGEGLKLAAIGVAIGLLGAFAAKSALASLLFGVKPGDPLTLGSVALLMILVSLLACYLPARRATNVNPMSALRAELETTNSP